MNLSSNYYYEFMYKVLDSEQDWAILYFYQRSIESKLFNTSSLEDTLKEEGNSDLLFALILAYHMNHRWGRNIDTCIAAYEKYVTDNNWYIYLIKGKLNTSGDYSDKIQALKFFNISIKLKPNFLESYKSRGLVNYLLENYSSAIEDYSRAIELDTENKWLNFRDRAKAREKQKDYHGAIEDYTKAIETCENPFFKDCYRNRAELKAKVGNYHGALDDYNYAIGFSSQGSTDPDLYNFRGVTKVELKDFHGAIDDFSSALKQNIHSEILSIEIYINSGSAKYNVKDYYGAIKDCSIAIELTSPTNYLHLEKQVDAFSIRGKAYFELMYYSEAIDNFTCVIKYTTVHFFISNKISYVNYLFSDI